MIVTLGEDGASSITNPTFKYEYMSQNLCMRLDKSSTSEVPHQANTSNLVSAANQFAASMASASSAAQQYHPQSSVAAASLIGQHDLYEIDRY